MCLHSAMFSFTYIPFQNAVESKISFFIKFSACYCTSTCTFCSTPHTGSIALTLKDINSLCITNKQKMWIVFSAQKILNLTYPQNIETSMLCTKYLCLKKIFQTCRPTKSHLLHSFMHHHKSKKSASHVPSRWNNPQSIITFPQAHL